MRPLHMAVLVAASLVSGCARMKPGLGFNDVGADVSERTGLRVHWTNGTSADAEASEAVNALLRDELSAADAVQIALLNNRSLQATYEELNLAQADLVEAGLLQNPVFSGEVRWATDGGGTGIGLELAQNFLSLLFIPLRQGRADAAFERGKLRVTGEVLDLVGQVRVAYYQAQGEEQLLEMRRSVVEATAASYDLAKRLRAAGNNRDLDVFNERALHEQSKIDLAAAESEVTQRREHLNDLMGLWGTSTSWRIASRLPAIPVGTSDDPVESQAVERSLDLAVARREIEVAARTLGIVKPFAGIDELEVGVVAEREVEGDWSAGPSVALPIPIFDQGSAAVGSALARLNQARHRYVATAVRVRARARAAQEAVIAARERATYYERVLLPLRQRIVDETQLQFNAMQVGAFQLLQAKRDQIESGVRYIETVQEFWLARSRLDQILSGRLPMVEVGGPGLESRAMPASASPSDGDH